MFLNPVLFKLDENTFPRRKDQALKTIWGYKVQKYMKESELGGMPQKYKNDEDEALDRVNEWRVFKLGAARSPAWCLASSFNDSLTTQMVGWVVCQ